MSIEIKQKFFNINFLDGLKFSRISKDKNPVHIDKLYGYNSIFGENIIHGVLTIIIFLQKIIIKKKFNLHAIGVKFLRPAKYDKHIYIKRKKKNILNYEFTLLQDKQVITIIDLKLLNKKTKNQNKIIRDYKKIFQTISYYTGMKYPGKNSLLREIYIKENNKDTQYNNLKISSKYIDPRLPLIKNNFLYKKYQITFISLKRPIIKFKNSKPNLRVINTVLKVKNNIMIIGASQGIGRNLLNLVKKNKKINIVATSFKNQIKFDSQNIKKIKLDISKNTNILKKFIDKLSPIRIYYFATSKISFDKIISVEKMREYKDFFLNYPLKILKENKKNNLSFFYPSTDFIRYNRNFPYSKIKLKAEMKLKKYCNKNNIKFIIHRFPAINSRQSASFSNIEKQDLVEYLNKNEKILNKILL